MWCTEGYVLVEVVLERDDGFGGCDFGDWLDLDR